MNNKIILLTIVLLITACGEADIAEVNGRGISQAEFDAYLKHKRVAIRNDKQNEQVLDQYLKREALAAVIDEQGLGEDELIKAELNELRKEVLINRYFEKFLNENVSEQAVTNYYNNNSSKYEEQKVHAAHILVRTNRSMDEIQRKAKLTASQEAHSKILGGMTFAEAAERYSEDAVSAKKGGDLGWVKKGSIDKAFSEKAFSLKVGEVSEPFESAFGYHVLTVLEEPQVIKRPFDAVKGEIRHRLRTQYKEAEMQRLVEQISISRN